MSIIELIIAIVCPFLYIVLLTSLFIYIFKKRLNFQTALPIALISATLFVFFTTALFHSISVGFWLTVIAALIAVPLLILDKDRAKVLRGNILTPGFVVFCLIYAFLLAIDWFKIVPLLSDTSMHWAPHVWTMWMTDDFYTLPGLSIVNHGEYPPAVQLFEMIFSKTAGIYYEGFLFFSMQILGISMLLPMLAKFAWNKRNILKQWGMIIALTLTIILIPLVFFVSDFYFSLEVDAILGIIFAYATYIAITQSKKFSLPGFIVLSLAITFLCLTKQIAILLGALVGAIYVLNLLISYRQKINYKKISTIFKDWKRHWSVAVIVIAIAIIPLAALKVWSNQTQGYTSPDPGIVIFHINPVDALQIPEIITGEGGTESQQHFSRAFIKHIFFDPGGFLLNNLVSISYMQVALVFFGIMALLWFLEKDKTRKKRIAVVAIVITTGWLAYCFAIYCVFLFGGMRPVELLGNDVSNRYLRTYLFAMLIIVTFYLIKAVIDNYNSRKNSKSILYFSIVLFLILGVFMNKSTLGALGLQSIGKHRAEFSSLNTYQTKDNILKLSKLTRSFEEPSKILVTAKTDDERHYLQYNGLPNRIHLLLFEEGVDRDLVCKKFAAVSYFVVGYDYPDEENWDTIKSCLSSTNDFVAGDIYKVNKNNQGLTLEKL